MQISPDLSTFGGALEGLSFLSLFVLLYCRCFGDVLFIAVGCEELITFSSEAKLWLFLGLLWIVGKTNPVCKFISGIQSKRILTMKAACLDFRGMRCVCTN